MIDRARNTCAESLTEDEVTDIDILEIQGCTLKLFRPCGSLDEPHSSDNGEVHQGHR